MSIYFLRWFLLLQISIIIIVKNRIEDFDKRLRSNFRLSKQAKRRKFFIYEKYLKILNIRSTHFFFPTWTSIPSNESIKVSGGSRYFKLWPLPLISPSRSFDHLHAYEITEILNSIRALFHLWERRCRVGIKAFPSLLFPQCFINVNLRELSSPFENYRYILSECAYDFTRFRFLHYSSVRTIDRPVYETMVHIFWFNCWANGGDFV